MLMKSIEVNWNGPQMVISFWFEIKTLTIEMGPFPGGQNKYFFHRDQYKISLKMQ